MPRAKTARSLVAKPPRSTPRRVNLSMVTAAAPAPVAAGTADDPTYHAYLSDIQARAAAQIGTGPVFATGVMPEEMWDAYLYSFTGADRQHYNCSTCRHFIKAYGALVTVEVDGTLRSVLWNEVEAPPAYYAMALALRLLVESRPIVRRVLSPDAVVGVPKTGDWRHYALTLPKSVVNGSRVTGQTAHEVCAKTKENVANVLRALGEFKQEVLDEAVATLTFGNMARSNAVMAAAEWLRAVGKRVRGAARETADAILWREVATAPDGFCHPRSSMLGTLLDDLCTTDDRAAIRARWAAKMAPDVYQRPTAPPKAGTITQAETLFAQMGLEKTLERRYALLSEAFTVWTPDVPSAPTHRGVFASLRPAAPTRTSAGAAYATSTLTWRKFVEEVLPQAQALRLELPAVGSYGAVTTNVHPDAPSLFRWGHPFSHYIYTQSSRREQWGFGQQANGLRASILEADIIGIGPRPAHWYGRQDAGHTQGAVLYLAGAVDQNRKGTLCLFPETLKAEMHGVRAVIEAASNGGELPAHDPAQGPLAAGYFLQADAPIGIHILAVISGRVIRYAIDRWD